MRFPKLVQLSFAIALALGGCSAQTSVVETGRTPTDGGQNSGQESTQTPDSGTPVDGGSDGPSFREGGGDAQTTDILGTLSGSCGTVRTLVTSPNPSLEDNVLVFVAGETYTKASLSTDGQRLYDTANAGGSSAESEVMSFEVLHACEGASLLKTETEISYAPPDDSGPNSITDILVMIGGNKVGVSVTRAYKPSSQALSDADVKSLLEKKLLGINRSSERVLQTDKWVKQILHVFAVDKNASDAVSRVWPTIDTALRADTIVLVTQTSGGGFVYCNPDPPLGSECP